MGRLESNLFIALYATCFSIEGQTELYYAWSKSHSKKIMGDKIEKKEHQRTRAKKGERKLYTKF